MNRELRYSVLDRDGWACVYCGLDMDPDSWTVTVDHDVPRSRGGTDNLDNLVAACALCNSRKGGKTGDEYRAWLAGRVQTFAIECPRCGSPPGYRCGKRATYETPHLERRVLAGGC